MRDFTFIWRIAPGGDWYEQLVRAPTRAEAKAQWAEWWGLDWEGLDHFEIRED